jgi:hypothetical protein
MQTRLWEIADDRNWPTLSDQQRTSLYQEWIRDDEIGGVLSRYLDARFVRVYIKDTIMKPYSRERISSLSPILKLIGLSENAVVAETYVKPHGRRFSDGKVVCWGLSRDWKAILFAVFERAYLAPKGVPFAAVIMYPTGKSQQPKYRQMVQAAAERLGIQHSLWFE